MYGRVGGRPDFTVLPLKAVAAFHAVAKYVTTNGKKRAVREVIISQKYGSGSLLDNS
jgi:hypothetical protein